MFIGEFVRYSGVAYAGGATRTRNVGASKLVTNGPFAYVRNPLYIGNIIMYSGATVITNIWQPWLTFAVILFLEEEKLHELFGAEYQEFCANVPRIIPRISPAKSENPVNPNWTSALKSEKSTLLAFGVILILLAVKMIYF